MFLGSETSLNNSSKCFSSLLQYLLMSWSLEVSGLQKTHTHMFSCVVKGCKKKEKNWHVLKACDAILLSKKKYMKK